VKRAAVMLALSVALVVATHLHTYPVGVALDVLPGHWVGLEIAPTPGFFFDVS